MGLPLASSSTLSAQNRCELVRSLRWNFAARGTPAETHWFARALFVCDDGARIYSDSAIVSPPQRLSQLFGNVNFSESGRELTADRANYRSDIDRLDAFGSVVLADSARGSTVEGENLVYLRGGSAREADQLTVTGVPGRQPRAVIVPRPTPPVVDSVTVADSVSVPDTSLVADSSLVPDTVPAEPPAAPTGPTLPTLPTVPPADALQPAPDTARTPYTVLADRIVIEGEEGFRGEGNAQVEREALRAYGDNMVYSQVTGELLISGNARSEGEGYRLTGQTITVLLPGDVVREIAARRQAMLESDDLDLTAPKIRIFVADEKLERLVASQLRSEDGPATGEALPAPPPADSAGRPNANRATAIGEDFTLVGDSLDVETPAETLERVVAVGRARAESYARDSLNAAETPPVARHDWIEGDTLVATFRRRTPVPAAIMDPAQPDPTQPDSAIAADTTIAADSTIAADTASEPRSDYVLDRLVATGAARSLYRLEPSDSTVAGPGKLALHYVLGDGITVQMKDGEIELMEVSGETRGFHLEPQARIADSLAPPPLTADTARRDTIPEEETVPELRSSPVPIPPEAEGTDTYGHGDANPGFPAPGDAVRESGATRAHVPRGRRGKGGEARRWKRK